MVATQRSAPKRATDDYLTTAEAADAIGYSAKTLSNWRALGNGPRWQRLPTGAVRYKRSELERWAKKRAQ